MGRNALCRPIVECQVGESAEWYSTFSRWHRSGRKYWHGLSVAYDVRGKRNDECEQGDYDTICGGRSHDETRQRQARKSDLYVDFNLLMLMIVWVVTQVLWSGIKVKHVNEWYRRYRQKSEDTLSKDHLVRSNDNCRWLTWANWMNLRSGWQQLASVSIMSTMV